MPITRLKIKTLRKINDQRENTDNVLTYMTVIIGQFALIFNLTAQN